ncbi:MAG: Crp/Fnr family transcriptional regulator [Actinobacteria bacterium]|nr:MAG: Crp/Fnr family transcriptional regulator [Actinomycetota bacterium]
MAATAHPPVAPVEPAGGLVRLLEADPELGAALEPDRRDEARRRIVARVVDVSDGVWDPRRDTAEDSVWGAIVLDGLLLHDLELTDTRASELIGPGDAFDPREPGLQESVVPVSTEWSVLEPTRLALLDRAFALSAARWPEVVGELHGRTAARAFRLSVQMAICQLPRVELRLMLALWHLAERFGRVGPEGVTLPLPLSHRLLGQVVGARRPTVTLALTRLHQAGLVERLDGVWRLHGHAPGELGELRTLAQARRRPAERPRAAQGAPLSATDREQLRQRVHERVAALSAVFEEQSAAVGSLQRRAEEVRARSADLRARVARDRDRDGRG